jgi:integrase/recombinase XerD
MVPDVTAEAADLSSQAFIDRYIDALKVERGLSSNTLSAYRGDLELFAEHLSCHIRDATTVEILTFQTKQMHVKATTANRRLTAIKSFYRWLVREKSLHENPTSRIDFAKTPLRVPKALTEEQVTRLLEAPSVGTPTGLRDKAFLELMYATGLRVSEAVELPMQGLNLDDRYVEVMGKGNVGRMVPMGEQAQFWVKKYIEFIRPTLIRGENVPYVFVSGRGQKAGLSYTRVAAWQMIIQYAKQVGFTAQISPHSLRHSFATHLLNHDADLRMVQLLMGHAHLSTTAIYTHIAQHRLKGIVLKHHPRGS